MKRKSNTCDEQPSNTKTYKLGELFCGPGGLALGAIRSEVKSAETRYRIEHAWANDYDLDSCQTYTRNICPQAPDSVICQDVKTFDLDRLSHIDAFAYGFPCNDFSIVGEHKGAQGNYGPLYTYGVRVIERFHPKFFVAENVGGITSANAGAAFEKIISDLENAGPGYNITTHLYKAEEYGVPQARHRIIIVGLLKNLGLKFRVPAPHTAGNPRSAKSAMEEPPIPADAHNNELTAQSSQVIERLRHIRPGENAWTANLPAHLQLNVKGARISQIYKRLEPDKPSYTVTGSGGGGTHVYHWKFNRALTNRERARLQTFPDNFIFEGSKESVRKQIGMAVPPDLSKIVFKAILNTLSGIPYEFVTSQWEEQTAFWNFA